MRLCLLSLLLVAGLAAPAYAEPPTNDTPNHAAVVSTLPTAIQVDTAEASTGPYEQTCERGVLVTEVGVPTKAVWYRLDLPEDVRSIRVVYHEHRATVSFWDAAAHGPSGEPILTERGCAYPDDPYPWSVRPGTYMSVGTTIGAGVPPFSVSIEAYDPAASVPNDAPYRATKIEALPYDVQQDTTEASYDRDPAGCPAGAYVWYTYEPVEAETIDISVSVEAEFSLSTIAVYELGPDVRTLGCDERFGKTARITTPVAAGIPVLIGIGGRGLLTLSVRALPGAGAGPDSRAGAILLAFGADTDFTTAGATLEPGEPTSCGDGGSIWFALPPRRREADVVVTGPTVSLAAVADDDVLACSVDGTLPLAAYSSATHVQLRSVDAAEGTIRLRFTVPYGQQLTDTSPFQEGCGDPGSHPYMNSEVEVHQAVDPHHPEHQLVTWQQDRNPSHGGANGIGAAVSFDGGQTWANSVVPRLSLCSGGPFLRATDPWAAIDADGTVYVMSLAYDPTVADEANGPNTVLLSRSGDGGLTWEDPIVVAISPGGIFHDKEAFTADPNTPGLLYAVWDAYPLNVAFPVFSRSEDGGRTWTPPVPLPTPGTGAGDQIAVLDDGTLVEIASRFDMQSITSRDRGLTWSPPTAFARSESSEGPPGVRGGAYIPSVSTDGHSVFVSWSDTYSTFFARSDDAGATWSVEVIGGGFAYPMRFTTAVAGTDSGRLALMTYMIDEHARAWLALATSDDGGSTWSEQPITERFDMRRAPVSEGRGYFLGDYFGLGASGEDIVAAFAAVPPGPEVGVSNVYTLHLAL